MKKIIFVILILLAGGGFTAWYLYNLPVADMEGLDADHKVSSVELFNAFSNDEDGANKKYLGKIVEVTGIIREIKTDEEGQTLILETDDMIFGVNCGIAKGQESTFSKLKAEDQVTVKGECTGMSMDVVMVRCVITENNNS